MSHNSSGGQHPRPGPSASAFGSRNAPATGSNTSEPIAHRTRSQLDNYDRSNEDQEGAPAQPVPALAALKELKLELLDVEAERLPAPGSDLPLEDILQDADMTLRELVEDGYRVRESHRVHFLKKLLTNKQLKELKAVYPPTYADMKSFLATRYSRQAYVTEKMTQAGAGTLFSGCDFALIEALARQYISALSRPGTNQLLGHVIHVVFRSIAAEFPNMVTHLRIDPIGVNEHNYVETLRDIGRFVELSYGPNGNNIRAYLDKTTRKASLTLAAPSAAAVGTSKPKKPVKAQLLSTITNSVSMVPSESSAIIVHPPARRSKPRAKSGCRSTPTGAGHLQSNWRKKSSSKSGSQAGESSSTLSAPSNLETRNDNTSDQLAISDRSTSSSVAASDVQSGVTASPTSVGALPVLSVSVPPVPSAPDQQQQQQQQQQQSVDVPPVIPRLRLRNRPVRGVADCGSALNLISSKLVAERSLKVQPSSQLMSSLWGATTTAVGECVLWLKCSRYGRQLRAVAHVVDLPAHLSFSLLIGRATMVDLGLKIQGIDVALPDEAEASVPVPVPSNVVVEVAAESVPLVASVVSDLEAADSSTGSDILTDTDGLSLTAAAILDSVSEMHRPLVKEMLTTQGSIYSPLRQANSATLPAVSPDIFTFGTDEEFDQMNAHFPVPEFDEDISKRLVHQFTESGFDLFRTAVLSNDLEAIFRRYPSGAPPPAAICPIRIDFQPGAKPLVSRQFPTSNPAVAAQVTKQFKDAAAHGIWEPTTAHGQVSYFAVPKPGEEAVRIVLNDVPNNAQVVPLGMALPSTEEVMLFLRDAARISSIDLASFFTSIRVANELRPFWCITLPNGERYQTTRLIQGSAVSPAIAQSFIHHVVRTFAPELAASGRFLAYIDNLYLKSIENEDENQHIQLVIQLLQALKNANLVINLKKSVFYASECEVLGHRWTADRTLSVPDRRVADLLAISPPDTLAKVRMCAGGVTAISRYMPMAMVLIAPLFDIISRHSIPEVEQSAVTEDAIVAAATQKRLSKILSADEKQLARETWMAVREVLMDIKNLYIPKAEDTLVLRVDAAGAGVGGVLLAQANAEDDQDVRVVAYYSKAFDGQQGSRPSWWLEAYGAKEAVAALYHIIAGRPNVFIETDSSTVLSIHNSDRDPNTHDLPRFAAELSSLGIQAGNMRHRRGKANMTADWLSRLSPGARTILDRKRDRQVRAEQRKASKVTAKEQSNALVATVIAEPASTISAVTVDPDPPVPPSTETITELLTSLASATVASSTDESSPRTTLPTVQEIATMSAEHLHALGSAAVVEITLEMQQSDAELIRIAELCLARQTDADATGRGSVEPYNRMRVEEGGLLQYFAYSKEPGFIGSWLPYCPPACVNAIVRRVHRAISHAGIDRTTAVLIRQMWCPNLHQRVTEVVRSCSECQRTATITHLRTALGPTKEFGPGECLAMDIGTIGDGSPLGRDFLVMGDVYSTVYEVFPLMDKTAAPVIEAVRIWINRHGKPQVLFSDNGQPFTSRALEELAAEQGISLQHSPPYWPQRNPAEIYVRLFKDALASLMVDSGDPDWSRHIPRIVASHALTPSACAGAAPWSLLYPQHGQILRGPSVEVIGHPDDVRDPASYEQSLQRAVRHHREAQRISIYKRANASGHFKDFEVGEWVTVALPSITSNLAQRYARRSPPAIVVGKAGSYYRISPGGGDTLPHYVPGRTLAPYYHFDDEDDSVDTELQQDGFDWAHELQGLPEFDPSSRTDQTFVPDDYEDGASDSDEEVEPSVIRLRPLRSRRLSPEGVRAQETETQVEQHPEIDEDLDRVPRAAVLSHTPVGELMQDTPLDWAEGQVVPDGPAHQITTPPSSLTPPPPLAPE